MAYFKRGDVELYYEQHGKGPETVVFLNGIMMSARSWITQAEALAPNYSVILNDLRGQGQSSKPDAPYTWDMHVEDLKALLDHLGVRKAHFIGTSYGGELEMAFALKYPEYVHTMTIAASVSHYDALLKAKVEAWRIGVDHALRFGLKKDFFYLSLPFNYSARYLQENLPKQAARAESFAAIPDSWFVGLNRLCECANNFNVTDQLHQLEMPILVIAGAEDQLKPLPFLRMMVEGARNAQLEIVEAGHALVIEVADEFQRLFTKFIKEHPIRK